ncbi:DUF4442 domain-containing protein [Lysobacter sp. CA199]|uniref:DUF4442 domain-containing protein n=1 Tax=Lysobacter sp. CA199 TaxID=3455608 RepID=UPI003F8D372F
MMTDATIPKSMRWIPKGMSVDYLKKAVGTMRAVATPAIPVVGSANGYELPVKAAITDPSGDTVFRARIGMWVAPCKQPDDFRESFDRRWRIRCNQGMCADDRSKRVFSKLALSRQAFSKKKPRRQAREPSHNRPQKRSVGNTQQPFHLKQVPGKHAAPRKIRIALAGNQPLRPTLSTGVIFWPRFLR